MIIAGTGHRPDKLGGYSKEVNVKLVGLAADQIIKLQPKLVISGMALGWDQALANAALLCNVPFHAYIPFVNQDLRWPLASKVEYHDLLSHASKVKVCSEGEYAIWKMQKRNEDMVNNCDLLLALWDGSNGGTGNCIGYANRKGTKILNVWKEFEEIQAMEDMVTFGDTL